MPDPFDPLRTAPEPARSELIQYATEIKVRAERRCGELLASTERNKGATVQGRMAVERHDTHNATLADMGLTRDESSRYQQLAAMPAEHFEATAASLELRAHFLRINTARDLVLYARTGGRECVWRIYRAHREAGMPIPATVLAIFDDWAAEAPSARTAKAITNAARNLDVVDQLHIRQRELEPAQTANDAARAVAADMGMTFGNVKVVKARWTVWSEAQADTENGALT